MLTALNAFPHLSIAPAVKQSTAMSALRRRHTPLEEMFLDEECATYTSRLLSCPLQPRSGNPVAATLLFQDYTVSDHCFLNCAMHIKPVVKLAVDTSCYLSSTVFFTHWPVFSYTSESCPFRFLYQSIKADVPQHIAHVSLCM